jgi:hypothetical protein
MIVKTIAEILLLCLLLIACKENKNPETNDEPFVLEEISIDGLVNQSAYEDISTNAVVVLTFSEKVDLSTTEKNITLKKDNVAVPLSFISENNPIIQITFPELATFSKYELTINSGLKSESGTLIYTGRNFTFSTGMDLSDKFPIISDEALMAMVQEKTFRYFWDFAHPSSGMARERTTSGNTVTTGGTGFGIMAIIAASYRNFISKQQALDRIIKIVDFLGNKCVRYHGAFSHWINGETGATIPFSANDDGADIVETAFLFQGLLSARAYFDGAGAAESKLRADITGLWEAVEWTWFTKNGETVIYWHWSPDKAWTINLKVSGWNEALLVYVLAASSPTHAIDKRVYDEGWARNGAIVNGSKFYGITLPLGNSYGGPLFFCHYSFLGLDPKRIADQYADYWEQNCAHCQINYNYCVENPQKYGGYGQDCWGLTASDGNEGYSAFSPSNDKGVIAPTAAIASLPYTPEASLRALRFFYYKLGDKLWGEYGFYDAFNLSQGWFDNQYLAIDQGPIVVMIENYRSGLLWSLFMSDTNIIDGLKKLDFQIK